MAFSPETASPETSDIPERRKNLELREKFEEAYDILEPFYAEENRWNGQPLDQFAYHRLRDAMPQLSAEECFILVVAARRVFGERNS